MSYQHLSQENSIWIFAASPALVGRGPPISSSKSECFIVRDANGQALSYIDLEAEPIRCSTRQFLYALLKLL